MLIYSYALFHKLNICIILLIWVKKCSAWGAEGYCIAQGHIRVQYQITEETVARALSQLRKSPENLFFSLRRITVIHSTIYEVTSQFSHGKIFWKTAEGTPTQCPNQSSLQMGTIRTMYYTKHLHTLELPQLFSHPVGELSSISKNLNQ